MEKIAVIGKMERGKNTVTNFLIKEQSFIQMALAYSIKELVAEFFPKAFEGGGKPREHYQHIGKQFRKLTNKY